MDNIIKISVIIPVYNGEKYLQDTLYSLYQQTFKDYEIIVVNDGSTDKTEEILEQNSQFLRIVKQSNKGRSVARNNALELAKGDYIMMIDADDFYFPYALEILYETIVLKDADIVYGDVLYTSLLQSNVVRKRPELKESHKLFFQNKIMIQNFIIRKQFIIENKLYFPSNLSIAEDTFFFSLALVFNPIVVYIPLFISLLRLHGDNTTYDTVNTFFKALDYLELLKRELSSRRLVLLPKIKKSLKIAEIKTLIDYALSSIYYKKSNEKKTILIELLKHSFFICPFYLKVRIILGIMYPYYPFAKNKFVAQFAFGKYINIKDK